MIIFGIVIWIVGIPIALGYSLRGRWPKMQDEFWRMEVRPWLLGVLWPLALVIFLAQLLVLRVLWFVTTLVVRGLFRFGAWLWLQI